MVMLVAARFEGEHRVWLKFADGVEGVVDFTPLLGGGPVFRPLQDLKLFRSFKLDSECNNIQWPTGASPAPEFLYEKTRAASHAAK